MVPDTTAHAGHEYKGPEPTVPAPLKQAHVVVNVDLDDANCKISVFLSNDVIANAFEEIYFLSSYNHWEIYFVSLQVHLAKYISCHPMHLCIVKEERRRLGWTNNWIFGPNALCKKYLKK